MGRHTKHVALSDDEFKAVADANVAALNYALQAVPASRVRLAHLLRLAPPLANEATLTSIGGGALPARQVRIHVCWGNYAGPHHHDIAASIVWPSVAAVHAKYILIEAANPRHGHEVAAFEEAVASGLFGRTKVRGCPHTPPRGMMPSGAGHTAPLLHALGWHLRWPPARL